MPKNPLQQIAHDLTTPRRAIPALSTGLVIALLSVIIELSFASLIFSGPLAPFAPAAAGLTLFGGFILCLVVSMFSEFPTSVAIPQDAPAAIMATVAAGIVATDGFSDPLQARFTVAAAMAISTLATAALFLLIGKFRLGNLMRYMPYPVMGGFLAGIGWLLVQGSVAITTDVSLSLSGLPQLLTYDKLMTLLPAVLLMVALLVGLMRWGSPFTLPGLLAAAMGAFCLYLAATGQSFEDAGRAGLLLGGMPKSTMLWPVFQPSDLGHISWNALVPQLPQLLTIPLVSAISFLLMSSGMETAAKRDMDLTRELYVNAGANLLCGAGGSHAGYTALSLSLLGPKTGSDSRLVGLSCALFIGAATFFGASVLGFFPRFILGGMVLFLGVATLLDWVVAVRKQVSRLEYALIIAILLATGMLGFLEGVGLGLVLATVIFVIKYSRLPVLRQSTDASKISSARTRSVPDRHILRERGHGILILRVTGYLFFGSASALGRTVSDLLKPESGNPPSHLILDFADADGFDSSAVNSFLRVLQRCASVGCTPLLSATPKGLEEQMRRASAQDVEGATFLPDLDRALELAEDQVLANAEQRTGDGGQDSLFDRSVDDLMRRLEEGERFEALLERLGPYLERRTFAVGEVIQPAGKPWPGVWMIVSGHAEEISTNDDGTTVRLRSLVSGDVAGFSAPDPDSAATSQLVAEEQCEVMLLSAEKLRTLEASSPVDALAFYTVYAAQFESRS